MPVILGESVRGTQGWATVGHLNAGVPRGYDFNIICSQWMSLDNHSLNFSIRRSMDGGVSWIPFGGTGEMTTKGTTKGGVPATRFGMWWDGQECDVEWSCVVTPAPFAWGIELL